MILPSRNTLIAVALVAAIAFAAGYYTRGKFDKAAIVVEAKQATKDTARGIEQSVAASQKVETSIAKSDQKIDQIKQAVSQRLKDQSHATQSTSAPSAPAPGFVLDAGTVRLLNAARAGAADDAAGRGDDQERAAAAAAR